MPDSEYNLWLTYYQLQHEEQKKAGKKNNKSKGKGGNGL